MATIRGPASHPMPPRRRCQKRLASCRPGNGTAAAGPQPQPGRRAASSGASNSQQRHKVPSRRWQQRLAA